MKRITLLTVLVLSLCLFYALAWAADSSAPPKISFIEESGEVGIVLDAYYKADIDTIWAVLTDSKNAPKMFDNLTLFPVAGQLTQREYRFKHPFGALSVICEVKQDDGKHHLRWNRIKGDFVAFKGEWKLTPSAEYPGYVHAHYVSFANPGGVLKRMMTKNRRKGKILAMSRRLGDLIVSASNK